MTELFEKYQIPLGDWIQSLLDILVHDWRAAFQAIRVPIGTLLDSIASLLNATPPELFLMVLFLVCWQISSVRLAVCSVIGMVFLGFIGVWSESMTTVALVLTSVIICVVVGIPLGICAARSNRFEAVLRPILDVMQTLPGFVYMVPVVMLVGIGNVPGVIVTIVFALPPVIRLTNLGLREVPGELLEAARAFGSSESRLLLTIQLPLAGPTIMAGVNQTLMMTLSMVVYASMIAVEGLGQVVLRGIGRLDMGLAAVGGFGIVILAVILDRVTQAMAVRREGRITRRGPIGMVRVLIHKAGAVPVPVVQRTN